VTKGADASATVLSSKTYGYNQRDWLESVTDSVEAANNATYGYDANGNQTSRTRGGVAMGFVYDCRDQLIEVDRGGTLLESYGYSYEGLRTRKSGPEGLFRFVYDDQSLLLQTDLPGNTVAKYDWGPDRLLSLSHATEGREFYLFDALGSVANLSKPDGTLQARYRWDAWGNLRSSAGGSFNLFGFTGYQKDGETGLYYAKARFYDPEVGRFLSEDPLAGPAENPPSLHKYLYAFNNPTVYRDLDGRRAATDQDRAKLRGFFVLENQLTREYERSGTFQGKPITQKQYEHALVDIRVQQESYVIAVMDAREGEDVNWHLEPASFSDNRGVQRYRPVPSRERWERETAENQRILIATIEAPNIVAGLLAGAGAAKVVGRPTKAGEMFGEATENSRTLRKDEVTTRESPQGPNVEMMPSDIPPGFRTTALPNGPVQELEVGDYGRQRARDVRGDRLEHDHIPSFAAIKVAEEQRLGRKLTPQEAAELKTLTSTITVRQEIHKDSPTKGGRNTRQLVSGDAANLAAAAKRDAQAFVDNAVKQGIDRRAAEQAAKELHKDNIAKGLYSEEDL
jgi:RHS repeat-associated protein